MNKVKKEMKNNKYTVIAILLFFLLIIIGFILYKALFPNSGKPVYGNRLEGIEEVNVSDNKFKEINEKLEENKNISSAKGSIGGRIIKYVIVINEKVTQADAKKIPDLVIKEFSKEQLKYFDVEVFIMSSNEEEKGYPIIAYKNKNSDKFSFSSAS